MLGKAKLELQSNNNSTRTKFISQLTGHSLLWPSLIYTMSHPQFCTYMYVYVFLLNNTKNEHGPGFQQNLAHR